MKFFDGVKVSIMGSLTALCFSSCSEIKTNDPVQSYKYWAGSLPPSNVKVIHGKYWQSAHWSKEYIMYLELEAPTNWINQFNIQNNLKPADDAALPSDAPSWFKPSKTVRVFKQAGSDQGSRYFEDPLAGKMFVYEVQL
jgi:hypothetical protein